MRMRVGLEYIGQWMHMIGQIKSVNSGWSEKNTVVQLFENNFIFGLGS
jgi:hypothetical protein